MQIKILYVDDHPELKLSNYLQEDLSTFLYSKERKFDISVEALIYPLINHLHGYSIKRNSNLQILLSLTQSYMKSVMLVMTYQQGKIFVFYLKVSFHLKLHWYLLNKKII